MVKITYVPDAEGNKQVWDLIMHIAASAKGGNESHRRLTQYIAQALDQLKDVGIPDPPELIFETVDVDDSNRTLTFKLLKELKYHPPLLEFRVNQRPEAFRAVFFYDTIQNEQVVFFTRALLKRIENKNPPELEKYATESEQIYREYLKDKEKFVSNCQ